MEDGLPACGFCRGEKLELYFAHSMENERRPGPKGHVDSTSFRGLKPPAPSAILNLQLSYQILP